ncbi:MAG TPA: hypothetical protein VII92_02940 [Anaerolineae bacterium]
MTDKADVIWGPPQQQPGGQPYRVGSSTGTTLPDQPNSSAGANYQQTEPKGAADLPRIAGHDTPRTDKFFRDGWDEMNAIDFARQLEHELAAKDQRIADLTSGIECANARWIEERKARDDDNAVHSGMLIAARQRAEAAEARAAQMFERTKKRFIAAAESCRAEIASRYKNEGRGAERWCR